LHSDIVLAPLEVCKPRFINLYLYLCKLEMYCDGTFQVRGQWRWFLILIFTKIRVLGIDGGPWPWPRRWGPLNLSVIVVISYGALGHVPPPQLAHAHKSVNFTYNSSGQYVDCYWTPDIFLFQPQTHSRLSWFNASILYLCKKSLWFLPDLINTHTLCPSLGAKSRWRLCCPSKLCENVGQTSWVPGFCQVLNCSHSIHILLICLRLGW